VQKFLKKNKSITEEILELRKAFYNEQKSVYDTEIQQKFEKDNKEIEELEKIDKNKDVKIKEKT